MYLSAYPNFMFMAFLTIPAFLLVMLLFANKYKLSLVETLPVTLSLFTLVLYGLAFFNGLYLIDYLSVGILIGFILVCIFIHKDKSRRVLVEYGRMLCKPSFLVTFSIILVMTFLVRNKLVSWWDDYNFWATDVKSIYYLNGFAKKYMNVAPEFGDYPPGTQLVKWLFLHFKSDSFDEGLMFAGYYFILISFLAPFLKKVDEIKNIALRWGAAFLGGAIIIFIPSCVEAFFADGCCADLCMALAYGAFLLSVIDEEHHEDGFLRYGRGALFLCFMMLCKNTSYIWLLFAFIFALSYELIMKKKNVIKGHLYRFVPPVLIFGSWYAFCLLMRRISRLASNSVKMATGSMALPDYDDALISSFFEGFFKYPIHRYENGIFNMSPAMFFSLVILAFAVMAVVAFKSKDVSKGRRNIFLLVFAFISGLLYYGILFVTHLTLFATEEQYLEPFAMVSSIERYSCPFSVGMLMLIAYILLEIKIWYVAPVALTAFTVLTCDPEAIYRAYIGYEADNASIMEMRESLINEEILSLASSNDLPALAKEGRILYIRDRENLSWISHAYISFYLSPVSVVYDYVEPDGSSLDEELNLMMEENHASFVYYAGELR